MSPLLPDCYQRAAKPMVTVLFGYNDGLDFMAGGSYRIAAVEVAPPKKQNAIVRMVANRTINARPWLAYKYIPSLDGPPDADYPTITQNDTKIDELWFSKSGTVFFGDAAVRDVGHGSPVVDALRTLPIVELDRALHFRGSAVLRYDLSRRLR
jgi:hypothetical protein